MCMQEWVCGAVLTCNGDFEHLKVGSKRKTQWNPKPQPSFKGYNFVLVLVSRRVALCLVQIIFSAVVMC